MSHHTVSTKKVGAVEAPEEKCFFKSCFKTNDMFDHHLKRYTKMGKRKPNDHKDQQIKIMSKTGKQNT